MKLVRLLFMLVVLISLLAACVPQIEGGYQIAVINAPSESRVVGLANKLETSLSNNGYSGFTSPSRLRFIERNREMHSYRAVLSSAQIARTVGAEYAVFIGAPTYERQISEITPVGSFIKVLRISTKVQLEAVVVDPVTANELARYSSNTYTAKRIVPLDSKIPSKEDDPNIKAAIRSALEDIGPSLARQLESLRAEYSYSSE